MYKIMETVLRRTSHVFNDDIFGTWLEENQGRLSADLGSSLV